MARWLPIVLTSVVFAGFAAAAAEAAGQDFSGNVCGLLKPQQLASVHVTVPKCYAHSTLHSALGITYDAVWGIDKPAGAPRLNIGILNTSNQTMLSLMKSHPIKPRLVNGKTAANAQFVVGKYIVTINLSTPPSKPLGSIAPFLTLTRMVTAELS